MLPSVHDRGGPAYALLELGHANWRVTELVAATLLTLLVGVTAVMLRWGRLAGWTRALLPLAYVLAGALRRGAALSPPRGISPRV